MNLVSELQAECDRLVEQFHDEFADLRGILGKVVQVAAEMWEPAVTAAGGTITDLHGQAHCVTVRGLLLLELVGVRNPDDPAPPGPLAARYGQGMSAVLSDGRGSNVRVRRLPVTLIPDQGERLIVRRETNPDEGVDSVGSVERPAQLELGFEVPEAVLQSVCPEGPMEWFVLWSFAGDKVQLDEAYLAAVVGIDSPSTMAILASAPLPRKVRARVVVDEADNDFAEFTQEARDGDVPPA